MKRYYIVEGDRSFHQNAARLLGEFENLDIAKKEAFPKMSDGDLLVGFEPGFDAEYELDGYTAVRHKDADVNEKSYKVKADNTRAGYPNGLWRAKNTTTFCSDGAEWYWLDENIWWDRSSWVMTTKDFKEDEDAAYQLIKDTLKDEGSWNECGDYILRFRCYYDEERKTTVIDTSGGNGSTYEYYSPYPDFDKNLIVKLLKNAGYKPKMRASWKDWEEWEDCTCEGCVVDCSTYRARGTEEEKENDCKDCWKWFDELNAPGGPVVVEGSDSGLMVLYEDSDEFDKAVWDIYHKILKDLRSIEEYQLEKYEEEHEESDDDE